MMNEHGKSDRRVVPTKSPNKGVGERPQGSARPKPAEAVEGRRLAKSNPQQRIMFRTQRRVRMSPDLERIRQAASRDRKMRFTALFHHVYRLETLKRAYFSLNPKAAPGVDGVTWKQYGEALECNLQDLADRLARGAYRAQPTRRTYIPKADGRQRPLGITALEDKIVQAALVEVLNAIYEVDFLGFSYGSRPGRSPHEALDALWVGIVSSKVNWVLSVDIRGYFDAILHEWLVTFIEHRIADRRIVRLMQKWLKAGVLEDGEHIKSEMGSPQGASFSPLAANIYLHYVFDLWAHQWRQRYCRGDVRLIRYVDDIMVGFEKREEAEQFQEALRQRFARFGLELHPEKTRLIEFGRFAQERRRKRGLGKAESFNFLGFTHLSGQSRKGKFQIQRRTIAQRFRAKLAEIKVELRRRRHLPVPVQGDWLRSVLQGHYQYYGVPLNGKALQRFRKEVARIWQRSLSRRSHKGYVVWERMKRYVDKWLPVARIYHPYPDERFGVMTRGRSPVR
jgi:group II intron reverse transcriptase/maturase